jgi:hypothetical protein
MRSSPQTSRPAPHASSTWPTEFAALLRGAGLRDVAVAPVAFTTASKTRTDLLGGTVRSSALVLSQPDQVQASKRRLYGEALGRRRSGEGYEVPRAAKLGAAARS